MIPFCVIIDSEFSEAFWINLRYFVWWIWKIISVSWLGLETLRSQVNLSPILILLAHNLRCSIILFRSFDSIKST